MNRKAVGQCNFVGWILERRVKERQMYSNHINMVWGIMYKTDARSKLQNMPSCMHFARIEENVSRQIGPILVDLSISLPDAT